MKTTTIKLSVYEIGDVIQMHGDNFNLETKRRAIGRVKRGVVMGVSQRIDKLFSYKVVCSDGTMITLKPAEQGGEKYVGHIDMGLLLGGDQDD